MGKYQVAVTFGLSTTIEPYGQIEGLDDEEILDVDDNSSFYGDVFEVEGGEVVLTVKAEDEDDASRIAMEQFEISGYFADSSTEWEIINAEVYSVDEIKEPMTLRRAMEIVEAYLEKLYGTVDSYKAGFAPTVGEVEPSEEVKEAFTFILAECMKLRAQEVATRSL